MFWTSMSITMATESVLTIKHNSTEDSILLIDTATYVIAQNQFAYTVERNNEH